MKPTIGSRLKPPEPGSPGDPLYRVAVLLRNTYEVEKRRHINQRRPMEEAYSPSRSFAHDLGDLRREVLAKIPENIEDNPEGVKPKRVGSANVWFMLADLVVAKRFDPETFIRAQFQMLPDGANVPAPEFFLSPRALKNFHAAGRDVEDEVKVAIRCQRDKFQNHCCLVRRAPNCDSDPDAWAQVLEDEEIALSALFRYCVAVSVAVSEKSTPDVVAQFEAIAEVFQLPAAMQYVVAADAYDESWSQLLPAGFREQATVIYKSYYAA